MVHDVWSKMFNPCYKTVFFSINIKIKGWEAILKGGEAPCYHSLGETLLHVYVYGQFVARGSIEIRYQ